MKTMWLGALSGAALILAGCGGVSQTSAPPPVLTPPPVAAPPPVSTVSATLSIPLDELSRLVNNRTPQRFADLKNQKLRCLIGDCLTTLSATRTGPITVSGRNGALVLGVPFALSASIALPGPLSMLNAAVNTAGQLNASTAIALGPDWSIRPNTGGSVQFQNGRIKLGPLDTDVAQLWNSNAELLSRPLLSQLDLQMAPALAQQKQVAQLWAGAFAPIKLNTKPTTWLLLQPEQIRVGLPSVANNALNMGLGIDVRARLVASEERPSLTPTVLPPPAALRGPANHFAVSVPAVLPYETAAKLALDVLAKNPPRVGSHRLNITALKITPSGQDVVIEAGFCIVESWDPTDVSSGCGSGYLRGVPEFDATSQTIRISNVHYDVLTQNWMLSAMRGLAGGDLAKAMEQALQFGVGGQIKAMQTQVSAALAKPQGNVVTISGEVQSFGPVSLSWSKDGFVATVSAVGRVHAEVRM
ncbi:MAG: DUF4403 family protein [Rhizomicrobium sp.]|nr:DUF4403 family protein [Rhizomicrobium sp.]